jgi:hypothetical protein
MNFNLASGPAFDGTKSGCRAHQIHSVIIRHDITVHIVVDNSQHTRHPTSTTGSPWDSATAVWTVARLDWEPPTVVRLLRNRTAAHALANDRVSWWRHSSHLQDLHFQKYEWWKYPTIARRGAIYEQMKIKPSELSMEQKLTRNVQAETKEYRSCIVRDPIAHRISPSSAPGGNL